jgi:hypothetical protein
MEELSAGVAEHVRVEELTWGESVEHVGHHRFDVVIACGERSHATGASEMPRARSRPCTASCPSHSFTKLPASGSFALCWTTVGVYSAGKVLYQTLHFTVGSRAFSVV